MDKVTCIGCRHNQAGRWAGWSCNKGAPGNDDDYSCREEDEDKEFWRNRMNDEQREILRHALGLNRGDSYETTRNYYADEPDARVCSELVNKGAMIRGRELEGGLQLYHVTNFGKELAMKPLGWDS